MSINECISTLYQGNKISKNQAHEIACDIDMETAEVTQRVFNMLELLNTVLLIQGDLFDTATN